MRDDLRRDGELRRPLAALATRLQRAPSAGWRAAAPRRQSRVGRMAAFERADLRQRGALDLANRAGRTLFGRDLRAKI